MLCSLGFDDRFGGVWGIQIVYALTEETSVANEPENQNLEVMRNSDAEATTDPFGEIHQKLDGLLREVRALRSELATSR